MRALISIIKRKLVGFDVNPLGRWKLETCDIKINRKLDMSNEDHCGPCGQYMIPKIERFNLDQMKHYVKLDKLNTFTELEKSVKVSIDKIKEENYKNYFIYAYNKDYYKNKTNKRKYNKRRTLKIYKD